MQKKFLLRISPQLYAEIERWAQEELRSVNGQMEYLLREAVARRGRGNPPPPADEPAQPDATPDAGDTPEATGT